MMKVLWLEDEIDKIYIFAQLSNKDLIQGLHNIYKREEEFGISHIFVQLNP